MKILTIIGARPQIIKASALSRQINLSFKNTIDEVIVHTGQHYDANMSEIFFSQLSIPSPKYNLAVGSLPHAQQTSRMIVGIAELIEKENPNALVLYGDTNSTLAGAIAASKLKVPIVHIEAGLRSRDKNMPEEINRILCDNVSTLLFCPTKEGYDNLIKEGFSSTITPKPNFNHPNIYHCSDIMLANTLYFKQKALTNGEYIDKYPNTKFILCTIHRDSNTDDKIRLTGIFNALLQISNNVPIILPLHPRTKKMMSLLLDKYTLDKINNSQIRIIDPVSFLEMIYLEAKSSLIITDSGGVQKEAYYLNKPCIILRGTTEWIEIVRTHNALIANADTQTIVEATNEYLQNPPINYPNIFGSDDAPLFICKTMVECL